MSHSSTLRSRLFLALGLALATVGGQTYAAPSGSFVEQNKRTSGTWSIETRADGQYVVLSDDFKTKRAPDLKIFLSPRQPDQLTGSNATTGSTFVAELTSNKGGQAYKLPAGVNLDDFASVLIHCEQYSVFWAAGSL